MIYLTQINSDSCGDIALRHFSMLAFNNQKYLLLKDTLLPNASMYDIKRKAETLGVTFSGFHLSDPNALKGIKKPLIALVDHNGKKHYVVISKYIYGSYIVFDGAGKPRQISASDLFSNGSIDVLVIDKINRIRNASNYGFRLFNNDMIIHLLIHVTSLGALIGGLYFINVNSRFEYPLCCFALAVILFFVEQMIVIRRMKIFDSHVHRHLEKLRSSRDLYELFQLKELAIKEPLRIINSVALVIVTSGLLLIDHVNQSFAILSVIITSALYYILDNQCMDKEIETLAATEQRLFATHHHRDETFNALNRLSYRIAHKKIIFKSVYIFLIGAVALVMAALLGTVYLNFFLFEFGTLYLIGSNFSSLLDLNHIKRRYYQLMYRFFIA